MRHAVPKQCHGFPLLNLMYTVSVFWMVTVAVRLCAPLQAVLLGMSSGDTFTQKWLYMKAQWASLETTAADFNKQTSAGISHSKNGTMKTRNPIRSAQK